MIERKKSWWGGGTEVHVWRKRSEREREACGKEVEEIHV